MNIIDIVKDKQNAILIKNIFFKAYWSKIFN